MLEIHSLKIICPVSSSGGIGKFSRFTLVFKICVGSVPHSIFDKRFLDDVEFSEKQKRFEKIY